VGFEPTILAGERQADLLLRPRGYWDWLIRFVKCTNNEKYALYFYDVF